MNLEPGTLLSSNLRLVRKLGHGGMGSVWVAYHLSLQTEVAVKFMSCNLGNNEVIRERFAREATVSAQMKHPHVVQTFDFGFTQDGVPFIVMELLEGEDLDQHLERVGRLSLPTTVDIVRQTCKALSKAHSLGLIHRDIKPANVFLSDCDGEMFAKIVDFGVAKQPSTAPEAITMDGALVGTPYYMSPEQALNPKSVDHRSDLWSVAVVAYRCITGCLPFGGETIAALAMATDKGTFAPPSTLNEALPASLDTWFLHALHRAPEHRFANARELAESFELAALGRPVAPASWDNTGRLPLSYSGRARRSSHPPTFTGAAIGLHSMRATRSRFPLVAVLLVLVSLAAIMTVDLVFRRNVTGNDRAARAASMGAPSATALSAAPEAQAKVPEQVTPSTALTIAEPSLELPPASPIDRGRHGAPLSSAGRAGRSSGRVVPSARAPAASTSALAPAKTPNPRDYGF